jgi:CcmD family protein
MRLIRTLAVALLLSTGPLAIFAQQPPRKTPDEFVPLNEIPPEEQLPAAPMVVAAYSFVWIALVGYLFLLVRRVQRVEADLAALERDKR